MGVKTITFGGVSSEAFGIVIEHPPTYIFPERDYTVYTVPGRNGDVIIDQGSYRNVSRKYEIAFGERDGDYTAMANGVSRWLHSPTGYARLEDDYEPDYFRLAYYKESLEMENLLHQAGRATIEFICKPQRFLKSGEIYVPVYESGPGRESTNPTDQISLPYVTASITKGAQDPVIWDLVFGPEKHPYDPGSQPPVLLSIDFTDTPYPDRDWSSQRILIDSQTETIMLASTGEESIDITNRASGEFPKIAPGPVWGWGRNYNPATQETTRIYGNFYMKGRWWTL